MYRSLPRTLTMSGIIVILVIAVIHLIRAPHAFGEMAFLGVAFIANFLAAIVAAVGISRGSLLWGWGLGALIASGSIAGYFALRSSGMPSMAHQGNPLADRIGVFSIIVETLFLALCVAVLWRANTTARQTGNRV